MLDRGEDAETGVWIISREQDNLDDSIGGGTSVKGQQPLNEGERDSWGKNVLLMLPLETAVLINAALAVHAIRLAEIEQSTRSDRDNELVVERVCHSGFHWPDQLGAFNSLAGTSF
jgi:hypothetical protein